MQTLYALDLTEIPGADDHWRPRRQSTPQPALNHPALPRDGFASPLGFWFATAESWGKFVTPLRVEVFDPDEQAGGNSVGEDRSRNLGTARRSYQARLRLAAGEAQSAGSATYLVLEIDPSTARIGVDPDAWLSISETVLIVVSQFWRFLAINRVLDKLADWARVDLEKSRLGSLIQRRRSRELQAHRRTLQALLLDLPDFEGLLTNPGAGLAPGRSVRLYRALAAQLGLDRWRRVIDERVEVVEAVLDSLADSLNHLQALAFQIVLELAIVALLLLDVGLYLWASLSR